MSLARRFAVGSAVFATVAALIAFADPALAQPPGKGKGGFDKDKGGFEKKGPEKKEFEKKIEPGPGDAVRTLESELQKLKAIEADLEAKLRQLRAAQPAPKGPAPTPTQPGLPGGFGRGGFGPGQPGMPGGFGGFGGFGGGRGGMGSPVEGIVRAANGLPVEQIRELIGALDKLRAEKERAAPAPRPMERPGARPNPQPEPRPTPTPGQRPGGGASNEEILRKLEQLTREIEEIRRAIRK